jgi:predicted enzyme related to lactoylglutathione lyase
MMMKKAISELFNDFDRGKISRRHLLQALGLAAAAATPLATFGQGQCGGPAAGTAKCNTKALPPPFEPTGWKTVLLDHFTMQVAELDKEAAFYNALMGWKVRSNDGKTIVMDIGNWGGVVMRGGLPLPPPTPTVQQSQLAALAANAQQLATTAANLAAAEARGAGGGRGGNGGGGGGAAAAGGGRGGNGGGGGNLQQSAAGGGGGRGGNGGGAPGAGAGGGNAAAAGGGRGGNGGGGQGGRGGGGQRVIWDGFCWGIAPWDTNKVEAELKRRRLNPVADHNPKENFFSFKIKDPDGLPLQISNGNKTNRRTTPPTGELNMAPPFESTGWQTLYLDHISFGVSSYKETVAFYQALIGWIPGEDEGSLNETTIAPEIGGLLIRGPNSLAPDFEMRSPRVARMDHIAFGIANFDPDKVREELLKRGLSAGADTGAIESSPASEKDIHTATYKSYHTNTPNGFNLQISNHISNKPIVLG